MYLNNSMMIAQSTSSSNINSSCVNEHSEPIAPIEGASPRINYACMTLNDISTLESIDDLTAQQLQQILVHNYVSIAGCVEKSELISKVKLLYHDEKQKKESSAKISKEDPNENLCKVCLDANIDCVVLNCGHLCTCIRCDINTAFMIA
ncbi:unnamed protein product [Rotaria magnacalcarata]